VLAALLGALLSLGAVEAVLRLPFLPLPYDLRTRLFGCYESSDTHQTLYANGGELHVLRMKPNYSTTCVFNQLRWHHSTDAWGFRNPTSLARADVVLLGDSMTYGHGVEENQTIAHYLRADLSTSVANLGTTAASIVDYLALLRNFGLRLSPKVVVVLVFANDFDDVGKVRTSAEMSMFLDGQQVPELEILPLEKLLAPDPTLETWSSERVLRWVLTYQAYRHYEHAFPTWLQFSDHVQRGPSASRDEGGVAPTSPVEHLNPTTDPVEFLGPLKVAYARKAFSVMKESAARANAVLVLGFLPQLGPVNQSRDDAVERVTGDVARSLGLPYLDLRPDLSAADGRAIPGDRLPQDGHLSPAGAERAARAIARFLAQGNLLPRP
jgi:lysophospholipase L1-like esterase